MIFQISTDISIDPAFGFVKALRIVKRCEPKNIVSDSERMTVHLDFEGSAEQVLQCISQLRGLASIDVRLVISMCVDEPRKIFRMIGMTVIPPALSARVLAYAQCGEGIVFIEKTSRRDFFLARYARVKRLPLPVPPSIYTIYGYLPEIVSLAKTSYEVLKMFGEELLAKLRNLGIETKACREASED